ncbi:MAG: 3-dehydroquinate synthase [Robiginitomaculum sp.]|nr:3-dehydroquinate synthase [Robiginitomaculum sp.]
MIPELAKLAANGVLPVITDETVAGLHLNRLQSLLANVDIKTKALILPSGEKTKNFSNLEKTCNFLLEQEMQRDDCLVAFGGGVIGDLAGLASSLVKRGTCFVQIPTTLLAQVDSSVGGKTAINTAIGKNMVGTFHQPKMVIADIAFLQTLPSRQIRAGYAEILKLACLQAGDFFEFLENLGTNLLNDGHLGLQQAIARSVHGKAKIVAADEFESGQRALLNLGHTFAHALESEASGMILHGEAVAAGLGAAFSLSAAQGLCPPEDRDRVINHLCAIGLPSSLAEAPGGKYDPANLLNRMKSDKKNRNGKIHLILCRKIGDAFITNDVSETDLLEFMETNLGSVDSSEVVKI